MGNNQQLCEKKSWSASCPQDKWPGLPPASGSVLLLSPLWGTLVTQPPKSPALGFRTGWAAVHTALQRWGGQRDALTTARGGLVLLSLYEGDRKEESPEGEVQCLRTQLLDHSF